MSIPHSKVLSVSKGLGLGAELHHNSPSSTQIVNVSINKQDAVTEASVAQEPIAPVYPPADVNPYSNLQQPLQPIAPEPASDDKNNELQELLQYKDNVIEALSAILKIIESNPLIINKLIVASLDDLSQLIKLLTGADSVQINTNNDVECTCLKDFDFVAVDKIYVIKGNETLNFKYSFPDANKILDDHHVSVKLVRI